MNTPTAIFAGLALIAAAIYLGNGSPAISQTQSDETDSAASSWGPWTFKGVNDKYGVWKINSASGDFYFCTQAECTKIATK